MDTTIRFYNIPSLFDRAILAEERKDWQWKQFAERNCYTTDGKKWHSSYGKACLREKIFDLLNLACHNFHTDENVDEVTKLCYEYNPSLEKLNYEEFTPFSTLFSENPHLEYVPHKSLHEELNAGPLMDDDNLPF